MLLPLPFAPSNIQRPGLGIEKLHLFNTFLPLGKEKQTFLKESREDKEMELLAQEELQQLELSKNELIQKLTLALLPKDPRDE